MKVEVKSLVENAFYCKKVFDFFIKKEIIRKINPDLFEKYLNKSLNNLEFGNFILSEHNYSIKRKLKNKFFYDWCVVIYYYSIYHSVLALISKSGFVSKNHLASISALIYIYYHKNNILEREDIEFVINHLKLNEDEIEFVASSKELRERASYGIDEVFNFNLAKSLQVKTADFVNKIKRILKE